METQGRAADGDLWFVTSKQSLKVDELAANPNVGVIFFHEDDCSYVSIAGTARLCEDPDLVRAKWKEEWRAWFEAGADSPDICLIKVKVNEAEYWAPERAGLKVMFETARAALTGEHPEIKRPEKLVVGPEKIEPEFIDPA
jgi:general stress protein 26